MLSSSSLLPKYNPWKVRQMPRHPFYLYHLCPNANLFVTFTIISKSMSMYYCHDPSSKDTWLLLYETLWSYSSSCICPCHACSWSFDFISDYLVINFSDLIIAMSVPNLKKKCVSQGKYHVDCTKMCITSNLSKETRKKKERKGHVPMIQSVTYLCVYISIRLSMVKTCSRV